MSVKTEAETTATSRYGRLNIKINENTSRTLRHMMERDEATATEVVRRAVALLDLVSEEIRAGKRLELVSEDGAQEQIRLLY